MREGRASKRGGLFESIASNKFGPRRRTKKIRKKILRTKRQKTRSRFHGFSRDFKALLLFRQSHHPDLLFALVLSAVLSVRRSEVSKWYYAEINPLDKTSQR